MSFTLFDWSIVVALLGLMTFAALSTRKYNRGVADFLSAGRCARKYVVGVAEGLSCVGAITIVAWFEAYYRGGFSVAWWTMVTLLAQVVVAMSGWIAYRYRQTRALTLAASGLLPAASRTFLTPVSSIFFPALCNRSAAYTISIVTPPCYHPF